VGKWRTFWSESAQNSSLYGIFRYSGQVLTARFGATCCSKILPRFRHISRDRTVKNSLASPPNNDKDEGCKPKSGEESSGAPQGSSRHGARSRSAVEDNTLNKKQGESLAFFMATLSLYFGSTIQGQKYWIET